jgi:hypothetical protein
LLHAEQRRRHIITFCAELDGLLGGGVAPGDITECVLLCAVLPCCKHALTWRPRAQDLCASLQALRAPRHAC